MFYFEVTLVEGVKDNNQNNLSTVLTFKGTNLGVGISFQQKSNSLMWDLSIHDRGVYFHGLDHELSLLKYVWSILAFGLLKVPRDNKTFRFKPGSVIGLLFARNEFVVTHNGTEVTQFQHELSGNWTPVFGIGAGTTIKVNFGATDFSYPKAPKIVVSAFQRKWMAEAKQFWCGRKYVFNCSTLSRPFLIFSKERKPKTRAGRAVSRMFVSRRGANECICTANVRYGSPCATASSGYCY